MTFPSPVSGFHGVDQDLLPFPFLEFNPVFLQEFAVVQVIFLKTKMNRHGIELSVSMSEIKMDIPTQGII